MSDVSLSTYQTTEQIEAPRFACPNTGALAHRWATHTRICLLNRHGMPCQIYNLKGYVCVLRRVHELELERDK